MVESRKAACVFCGWDAGPLTKEHVLPQHWAQYFPDETATSDPVRRVENGKVVDLRGSKHRFENVVREVCGSCNSGWMQELDILAKPTVLALANEDARVITASEAPVFQAWATKTALMRTLMDRSAGQQARLDRFHEFYRVRQAFSKNSVQVARCARRAIDSNESWQDPDRRDAHCNVVSVTLGNLLFQVAIASEQDAYWSGIAGEMLRAAKIAAPRRISTVRADRDTVVVGELDGRETALVQDMHFLLGVTPRTTRPMRSTP